MRISVDWTLYWIAQKYRDDLKVQHSTFEVVLLITAEFWFNCHISLVLWIVPYQKRIIIILLLYRLWIYHRLWIYQQFYSFSIFAICFWRISLFQKQFENLSYNLLPCRLFEVGQIRSISHIWKSEGIGVTFLGSALNTTFPRRLINDECLIASL